jgi:hypothetical protein
MPFFSKTESRKVKQILSGCWYQWEGTKYRERWKEAEYGGSIMDSCMKMGK